MVKITPKLLSIPPHLATSWKEIISLSWDEPRNLLVVVLRHRAPIEIPGLERPAIDAIFEAHSRFSESAEIPALQNTVPFNFSFPMKLDGAISEPFTAPLHHNPQQANMPNLPLEFLTKVREILHAFGLDRAENASPAEPSCNCPYCQIARTPLNSAGGSAEEAIITEEEVSSKDLTFRTWDIKQTAEKLYLVTNPLDEREQYSVFLGDPLGCTCGQKNCEHIRAVLNT
jgi:hypothetical protein